MLTFLANASRAETDGVRAIGFREDCLATVLREQAAEGGWPWRRGGSPAIESTAWVLLSLPTNNCETAGSSERACSWLAKQQLRDGSWPAWPGGLDGCWVTAPACLALAAHRFDPNAIRRGISWLAGCWPADARWIARLARFFRRNSAPRYAGWSWTPGSASWVEPTACALLLLRLLRGSAKEVSRRVVLAEEMLAARVSPAGGWNCGDPSLYPAASSSVGTTVWALLAMRWAQHVAEKERSLHWLEEVYPQIQGAGSLALASLCLRAYGRRTVGVQRQLSAHWENNGFLGNVPVAAWAFAAVTDTLPEWLTLTEIRI